jgi:hypothetical protein
MISPGTQKTFRGINSRLLAGQHITGTPGPRAADRLPPSLQFARHGAVGSELRIESSIAGYVPSTSHGLSHFRRGIDVGQACSNLASSSVRHYTFQSEEVERVEVYSHKSDNSD